ncbi:GyrI-like domain-containing protein [Colwellia sp. BRX10-3]|uniref:AraC family transcriptional regulator n=1 Tax=Colwellia sp. BRX10-3 TaxID=2759844 RepID=UPI0015F74633|nr:GyrI-like domain-containing protein [Colwellia sp. BRX10-3]MBA6392323.1 GyrI-like domain-containing protein [Colwellia sp. BRX10-3]
MNKEEFFQVELVDFPATKIAAFEHRAAPNLIGRSITQFIAWRKENALPPSKSKTFNIIYDDPNVTADADYRFDIACAIKDSVVGNQQGVINKIIPAGQCAKVRITGNDDKLGTVINFLYSRWLPQSIFTLRDYPLFLERVIFYPEVAEADAIMDIYLPIE